MSPPFPITSLILSGEIFIVLIFGAYSDNSCLGSLIVASITSSICILALWALSNASFNTFLVTPLILISIWSAVIPFLVPATLKSISPIWSSKPWISVRIVYLESHVPSSVISPIAIPATGALIGTPADISDIHPAQILAWLDEPLLSNTSDTTRTVYGNSSWLGITCNNALSANAPCPISLLPGLPYLPVSPTLNAGKL